MIVSVKWLRSYVDISLSVERLVERLTMAGLEVDAVRPQNPYLDRVVAVRIEAVEPHPQADRLSLCTVSDGRTTYRVVCGAPNAREAAIVPLALPGARLAGGMLIEEARIRGVASQGMLCSQKELGAGEDAGGIWHLPSETVVGKPLQEALGLDDVIIEIGITPNRGDCLSMVGVAREIAAICGSKLRYPDTSLPEEGPPVESLASVTIEDPVGCPRYAARVIEGVKVGPSPAWMREKLEAVGVRSINNIVDVTNYVMMELGQPLHAFDFDLLRENRIVVKRATGGQRFSTLDGVERSLFDDTLLICDGAGPVAIAGIMGGLESEINPGTTRVLIESAYFQPICIRRSSKKLGLRSESSFRFERGIDPDGVLRALDRAAQLMAELAGGKIARGRIDAYPSPIVAPELTLRVERTNRFLGTELTASEMAEVLRSIEMEVEEIDAKRLRVLPPAFRSDIAREVDLTEEVVRLVGYDRVPVTSPEAAVEAAVLDPHLRARQEVKHLLEGAGFFEAINYSFISRESIGKLRLPAADRRLAPVEVRNPLSEEQAVMRTSLVPGLLQTACNNLDRRNDDLKLFELSKVFLPKAGESLPEEPHQLCGVLAGRRNPDILYGGEEEIDYTDVKGAIEAVLETFYPARIDYRAEDIPPYFDPRCAASLYQGQERLGSLGRLHPEVAESFGLKKIVYLFELDFDRAFALKQAHPLYQPLPKFPSVTRDMALVVDENLAAQEVVDFVLSRKEPLLGRVEIFDVYRSQQLGKDKKSLGYRLVYRAQDRSLTDEEVNAIHGGITAKVLETFQATLR